MDGGAVEFNDDITLLNTGFGRRRVGVDFGTRARGLAHPEGLGQLRGDVLDLHPDHAPNHLAPSTPVEE